MKNIYRLFRDLLIRLIPKGFVGYFIKPVDFVWLVHPRDTKDTIKKFPFLKFLPSSVVAMLSALIWPFIVSSVDNEGKHIKGYVIAVPLTPAIISKYKNFSLRKTRRAIALADKLGAKTISLGGFLPTVVYKNGLDKKFKISFFDGTSILPRLAFKKIEELLIKIVEGKKNKATIGIIGATTIVGNTLSKLLTHENNFNQLYLFGKTVANLDKLKEECHEVNNKAEIVTSTDLAELKKCDLVILTAYLQKDEKVTEYLTPNITFFSVIEPVSQFVFEIKEQRKDINVIMGISINTPGVVYKGYDFGLPKGNSFACVAEAMILVNNEESLRDIKSLDPQKSLKSVEGLLANNNFKSE